jgi:hypothetical protein
VAFTSLPSRPFPVLQRMIGKRRLALADRGRAVTRDLRHLAGG